MIDHIGIEIADFERARTFYDQALKPLGASLLMMVPEEYTGGKQIGGYGRERPVYWLSETGSSGERKHIAFSASSRQEVDAFYQAAIAAGGKDNGAPGLRPEYHPDYYGAFVLDPDGNNIEAVCHAPA